MTCVCDTWEALYDIKRGDHSFSDDYAKFTTLCQRLDTFLLTLNDPAILAKCQEDLRVILYLKSLGLEYSSLCWRRTSCSPFYDEWTSWSSVYQCNEIQYVPCHNDHYLTHIPFLPELRFEWVLSMFPQSTDETSTIRPMSFMSKVWAYTHYMLYHINDTLAWRSSHCYDGSWSRPKSSKGAGLSSVAW